MIRENLLDSANSHYSNFFLFCFAQIYIFFTSEISCISCWYFFFVVLDFLLSSEITRGNFIFIFSSKFFFLDLFTLYKYNFTSIYRQYNFSPSFRFVIKPLWIRVPSLHEYGNWLFWLLRPEDSLWISAYLVSFGKFYRNNFILSNMTVEGKREEKNEGKFFSYCTVSIFFSSFKTLDNRFRYIKVD